jgi:hypothetical protein
MYLSAVLAIFTSSKFTAVNSLKETYKDNEYDTTLWHLLLAKTKRWNYPEFSNVFHCLLSRRDLDLTKSGWAWSQGDTISAAELCFFEWCEIVGKAPKRQLWVDATIPRLCLLSACLHVQETGSGSSDAYWYQQLNLWIDKERRVLKQNNVLKKHLLQDLELMGSEELFELPRFLNVDDIFRLIARLKH